MDCISNKLVVIIVSDDRILLYLYINLQMESVICDMIGCQYDLLIFKIVLYVVKLVDVN
jgi:hypothetical protein